MSKTSVPVLFLAASLLFLTGCGKPVVETPPEPEVDPRFSSEPSVTSRWEIFIELNQNGETVRYDFGVNQENSGSPGDIRLTARPAHDAPQSLEVIIQHDLEEVSLPCFLPDDIAEGAAPGTVAVRFSNGVSVWRGDAVDGTGDFQLVIEEASEGNYAGTFSGMMLPDTAGDAGALEVEGRFEARKN